MFLLKESTRDWYVVALVGILVFAANLPDKYAAWLHIDTKYLLAVLIAVVGVSLLKYLKFTLILVVVLLAVGANLPADMASRFGVDSTVMMIALFLMVAISLVSRIMKVPTGLDKTGRSKSVQGAALLLQATLKGRTPVVQSLLEAGISANVKTISGKTPLMAASAKGYSDIVLLLLTKGAAVNMSDSAGNTALAYAAKGKFSRTMEILKKAGGQLTGKVEMSPTANAAA